MCVIVSGCVGEWEGVCVFFFHLLLPCYPLLQTRRCCSSLVLEEPGAGGGEHGRLAFSHDRSSSRPDGGDAARDMYNNGVAAGLQPSAAS